MASVTNRLLFDPTDANSIAASSSIGAYVRASDGTLIDATSNALHVNVTALSASNIDIRDLVFSTDSVTAHQGGTWTIDGITNDVNIADGGNSITVDAVNLDIRDLASGTDSVSSVQSGAWSVGITGDVNVTQGTSPWVVSATDLDIRNLDFSTDSVTSRLNDGSGNSIGSTGGSLDVNVTNDIDIDDDLANVAIENTATAVSLVAVNAVSAALANRKWLAYANEGNKSVYFGKTGVTLATGYPCHPGMQAVWRVGPAVAPQFIGGTGASAEDMRVMELS